MQEPYRKEKAKYPTVIIAIISVTVVVMVIGSLVFWYFSSRYGYYGYPYGYGMMGWWFPMMLIMFPIGLIVMILIAYVIYRAVRWGTGWGYRRYYDITHRETAMEVLRRRYANGEITKDQFEQMKRDLLV